MFYKCINSLKICVAFKKKGFIIENNKNNLNLLKNLLKLNIIKFLKIDGDIILVFVNYKNGNEGPIFKNIINLYKPGHKMYISLKNLKKISKKYNWIMLISTSKGVLNSYDAIEKNVGGLIIAKFWN